MHATMRVNKYAHPSAIKGQGHVHAWALAHRKLCAGTVHANCAVMHAVRTCTPRKHARGKAPSHTL